MKTNKLLLLLSLVSVIGVASSCSNSNTNIKDVEIGLARISVYIEENNYTEAYAEIAALIDFTAHYLDDFRISVENIF